MQQRLLPGRKKDYRQKLEFKGNFNIVIFISFNKIIEQEYKKD